jgi:hypothetical protein
MPTGPVAGVSHSVTPFQHLAVEVGEGGKAGRRSNSEPTATARGGGNKWRRPTAPGQLNEDCHKGRCGVNSATK